MNAQQRKFLVDKLMSNGKNQIEALISQKLKYPSASNYLFKAVLNGELKLQPDEVTLEALRKKALDAKEGGNWLADEDRWGRLERKVSFKIDDILQVPKDYYDEVERVKAHNEALDEQIRQLQVQLDTLEVRIQLASDKTLAKIINEVDDMGDLSLVDTKLKLISNVETNRISEKN